MKPLHNRYYTRCRTRRTMLQAKQTRSNEYPVMVLNFIYKKLHNWKVEIKFYRVVYANIESFDNINLSMKY